MVRRARAVVRLLMSLCVPRFAPGPAAPRRDRLATDAARRRVSRYRCRRWTDGDDLAAETGAQRPRHASLGGPVPRAVSPAAGASDAHRPGAPHAAGAAPNILARRDRSHVRGVLAAR